MVTYCAKDIDIRNKTGSTRVHRTRVMVRLFDWFDNPIFAKNRPKNLVLFPFSA